MPGRESNSLIQPIAQSLYVGTGAFGSGRFCAGCQILLFLLDCLVSLSSTYQQHFICFVNFILICFENVIFIVAGLLSCWFRSSYSIPTQKWIEKWERPLFLKTLRYEIWGYLSVVDEDTGFWDVRPCQLVKSYIHFGGPTVSMSRVRTLQDISRWRCFRLWRWRHQTYVDTNNVDN